MYNGYLLLSQCLFFKREWVATNSRWGVLLLPEPFFFEERIGCHKFKESGKFGPLFHWMQAYREMLPKQITESPSDRGSPTLQTMAEKQGRSQIT